MKPSSDESYRFLAAGYLRQQAKRLAGELVGVRRADDVECVHQARVASRRLRAAIGLFKHCLPKKTARRWRKSIRRMAAGLGEARDCDVHAAELAEMLSADKKPDGRQRARRRRGVSCAVAWLLVDLQRRREACQPAVLQEIDRVERDGVLEEVLHMAKETLVDAAGPGGDERREIAYSPAVYRWVGKEILDRYRSLQALESCLQKRKARRRHHQMRIAAKRLRYTMEIAQPIYAGRLDKSIKAVKKLQSLLGEIHDCDLWYVHLKRFSRVRCDQLKRAYGTARPFAELKRGFKDLRRRCKKRRRKRFRQLEAFWQKLQKNGQWPELLETLSSRTSPSRAAFDRAAVSDLPTTAEPALCYGPDCRGSGQQP